MKWFRIPKETTERPKAGNYYGDWKVELSIEANSQCVYCAINLNSFGGIRNFHVEHYRPKSKEAFKYLENEFSNLYFACSICNCFKGDDWPNDPSDNFDNHSYPEPSKIDYSNLLSVDNDMLINSKYLAGKYVIQKLFLNRPQLILERKSYYLHELLKEEVLKLKKIAIEIKQKYSEIDLIQGYILLSDALCLLIEEKYINPYTQEQIRR